MRLSPIIKDKRLTYSNSSFQLYATELIPVKSYQNSCGRYHKSCAKASNTGVFTIANASVYSKASQYSGAIRACKKFVST